MLEKGESIMTQKYSEDIQAILDKWLVEIQKLATDGQISPVLVENIQNLVDSGKIGDATKIRFAIESGVKNVGAN